jgi:hypothetical protein
MSSTPRGASSYGSKRALLGVVGALLVASLGCGAEDVCGALAKSKCTADPVPSQADLDLCRATAQSKCGSQYTAYLKCLSSNQTCDTFNHTDHKAQDAACATQVAAVMTACAP